jgi:hypothetical protein
MTSRPAYFVVYRVLGREVPAIFWDELPKEPIRQLSYVVRLDLLPNAADLVDAPLWRLYAVFCHLRKAGKLPARWEPPPQAKDDGAKVLTGHREEHPRRHLPDTPYDPHA